MKNIAVLGLIGFLGVAGAAPAATAQGGLLAPSHRLIDGFNNNDMKTAASALTPAGVVILDDIAPHLWSGPAAFESWGKTLDASDQAAGNTDEWVAAGQPGRIEMDAETGYVVLPVTYTWKQHGAPMTERAHMVFTLRHAPGGWLINGFTWVGGQARPAPPAAKR